MKEDSVLPDSFRFIGSLDSARNSHVIEGPETKDTWWLPRDKRTFVEHNASAEAMCIKQVIGGDVITLSRNQFFDSPAWYNLVDYLMAFGIPTFAVTIYPKELPLEPSSFIEEISNSFQNASFALSAWPGLEKPQREQISQNINQDTGFDDMLKGITVDSSFKEIFTYQQLMLQKMLKYLQENYQKEGFEGLISRAYGGKTSLWDKVTSDIDDGRFVLKAAKDHGEDFANQYCESIMSIQAHAKSLFSDLSEERRATETSKWLNQRTNLYRVIYDYDPILRGLLRETIDVRYAETLAESCTGLGRFERLDRSDTALNHEVRDDHSDNLDASNDPKGLLEDTDVLFADSAETRDFLEDIVDVINNEEVVQKITEIRQTRHDPEISNAVAQEREAKHLDFMAEILPELVIEDSARSKVVRFVYNRSLTLVIVIGILFTPDLPLKELGIARKIARLINEYLKEEVEESIEERIRERGEVFLIDHLFRGKRRVLTGKVRNWLKLYRDGG